MAFFNKRKSLIGLDVGSECIKAIEISQERGDFLITGYGQIDVNSEDAKEEAISELLRTCSFKTKKVASAVSGRSLIVRFLNIVEMPEENLNNAIRYEADKYIPFDIDNVILDCQKLEDTTGLSKNEMKVILVAVKREIVDDHYRLLQNCGLQPCLIDIDVFALANAFEFSRMINGETNGESKIAALVDIGGKKTCINIVRGHESLFTREIYMGGSDFTGYISKKTGLESFESEEIKRNPGERSEEVTEAILPGIEEIGSEINLSFDYFENQYENNVEEIYLSGGGGRIAGLDEALEKIFERRTMTWSPVEGIGVVSDMVDAELLMENASSLAVATGLASRIVQRTW
ncbi:MAG: pilus assembly protein PilM [Planctomycetes bacterium]|nr:pilus assembly protein PilM [Planctomycetota bacterium]